jgi:Flp pilus assembly pilin Flp
MGCRRDRSNTAVLARFLSDQEGQATVEYMLILSVVIAGAGLLSRKLIQAIDAGILKLGGQLEKDLKTGRAPTDVWQN